MLLVHAARKQRLNVFVETSGRDIAMYKYIDEFFPVRGPRHLDTSTPEKSRHEATRVQVLRKVVSKRTKTKRRLCVPRRQASTGSLSCTSPSTTCASRRSPSTRAWPGEPQDSGLRFLGCVFQRFRGCFVRAGRWPTGLPR